MEKGDTNALANRAMLHLLGYSLIMHAGILHTLAIKPPWRMTHVVE